MLCVKLVQSVSTHYMLNNVETSRSKTETIEETVQYGIGCGMALYCMVEVKRKYCLHLKVKHVLLLATFIVV